MFDTLITSNLILIGTNLLPIHPLDGKTADDVRCTATIAPLCPRGPTPPARAIARLRDCARAVIRMGDAA